MIVLFQLTGLDDLVKIVVNRVSPDDPHVSITHNKKAYEVLNNIIQLYMCDLDPSLPDDKEVLDDEIASDIFDNVLSDEFFCVRSMRYILSLIPKDKIQIANIINNSGDLVLVINPPR